MYTQNREYCKSRVIDTLLLARKQLTFLENYKLVTIKNYLNIDVSSNNALDDCLVTAKLYQYLRKQNIRTIML